MLKESESQMRRCVLTALVIHKLQRVLFASILASSGHCGFAKPSRYASTDDDRAAVRCKCPPIFLKQTAQEVARAGLPGPSDQEFDCRS